MMAVAAAAAPVTYQLQIKCWIRGYHVYQTKKVKHGQLALVKILPFVNDQHNHFAVAVLEEGTADSHLPREISCRCLE